MQSRGAKVGVQRVPGDDAKPEPIDYVKKFRATLPIPSGIEDLLAYLLGYTLAALTICFLALMIGIALRLFLFGAGFREVLY